MLLSHNMEDKGLVSLYLSSNIVMSKYLPNLNELLVIFKSGDQYLYKEVDLVTFIDFEKADSQGKFLNTVIKKNHVVEKQDKSMDVKPILEQIQVYKSTLSK